MVDKTALGDRMKAYEKEYLQTLPHNHWVIIRIDGKSFHTYASNMNKPFDDSLRNAMVDSAIELCGHIDGIVLGYLQSDECSLLVPPRPLNVGEHWLGGKVSKIASICSSIFTAQFNSHQLSDRLAYFDARAFSIPSVQEARSYLCWRQMDATRNSISSIARKHFSHKQLHGVKTYDRIRMLEDIDVRLEDYPASHRVGTIIYKEAYRTDIEYHDAKTDTMVTVNDVLRTRWVSETAPIFKNVDPAEIFVRRTEEVADAVHA